MRGADPRAGLARCENILRHYFDQDVAPAQTAPVKAALSSFLGISRASLVIQRPSGRWPAQGGAAFGPDGLLRVDIRAPGVLEEDWVVGLDNTAYILLPRPDPKNPTFSDGTHTLQVSQEKSPGRWSLDGKPVKDLL